jgi:hypothetical protein
LNFSLWILFVLDYLLLEITTPLIVYIWRRHGGTCKFGFEFYLAFFWSFIWVWKRWSNYIFNMKSYCASLKCTSVNAFIPQWNFKRMHSILRCFFLYHRSFLFFVIYVIWINYMCNILKASILGMTEDKFEYTKRVIIIQWMTEKSIYYEMLL